MMYKAAAVGAAYDKNIEEHQPINIFKEAMETLGESEYTIRKHIHSGESLHKYILKYSTV